MRAESDLIQNHQIKPCCITSGDHGHGGGNNVHQRGAKRKTKINPMIASVSNNKTHPTFCRTSTPSATTNGGDDSFFCGAYVWVTTPASVCLPLRRARVAHSNTSPPGCGNTIIIYRTQNAVTAILTLPVAFSVTLDPYCDVNSTPINRA